MSTKEILNETGEVVGFQIVTETTINKDVPDNVHWIKVSGDPNAQPSVRELQSKAASDVTHLFFGGNQ